MKPHWCLALVIPSIVTCFNIPPSPRAKSISLYPLRSTNFDEECWNPRLRRIVGGIAVAGTLETSFLTYSKLAESSAAEQLCSITGGSCSSVLNGPYAVIPGSEIPLAAVGVVAYVTVAALALGPTLANSPKDDTDNRILLTAVATSMGVFSVFLMTLLFGVLKESCAFCVASAIFSISMAKLLWLGGCLPEENAKTGVSASISSGFVAFMAAIVLFTSNIPPTSAVNFAGQLVGSSTSLVAGESPPTITTTSSTKAMVLAKKMQTMDTRFYGAFWCSHCFDQKQAMGKEAMAMIPYIECSRDGLNAQTKLCKEKDVPGYPTWEINGKLYPGEKTLDELEEIVKNAALPAR
ncbi:hypothetical protein FisN_7Lh288 [Fistulifera solaris]|uniref:Vitamin K epoxide reductase domain-containing protein n=1 Tax=Fistulifera solaris TaxID=1519565 RepID=A0A1Z5JS18_FISSO|nr:hypothetical protein FisN_7Lh288 [Fistulifera solaris]|eukprot:GAX16561.1 hypothetical protein FisN_7Lh288 [Fistulifera solaris]